jgi:isoleucyl-tRNA synthetase
MKAISASLSQLDQASISEFESNRTLIIDVEGQPVQLESGDAEIISEDIPGWSVASEGSITVALDVTLTESLKEEGIARELVNRIQNLRKESGFEITDRINLSIQKHEKINAAVNNNLDYICDETLADSLDLVGEIGQNESKKINVVDDIVTFINITRIN